MTRGSPTPTAVGALSLPVAGFPTEATTGVPPWTVLAPSESVVVTEDGTVLDSLHVRGSEHDAGNRAVEDTEIDGNGQAGVAILWDDYTLRRVNIHDVRDGLRIEGPDVLIDESYVHHLSTTAGMVRWPPSGPTRAGSPRTSGRTRGSRFGTGGSWARRLRDVHHNRHVASNLLRSTSTLCSRPFALPFLLEQGASRLKASSEAPGLPSSGRGDSCKRVT